MLSNPVHSSCMASHDQLLPSSTHSSYLLSYHTVIIVSDQQTRLALMVYSYLNILAINKQDWH